MFEALMAVAISWTLYPITIVFSLALLVAVYAALVWSCILHDHVKQSLYENIRSKRD